MRVREGGRSVTGFRGRVSGRGWCAAVAAVVVGGMPLVTAAHAPAAVCYRVTRTIPVGGQPDAVAVDPVAGTVYVANAGDGTVSVIDAATGAVTRTIPVGYSP
jgi:YVTN family beta-propeller protein